MDTPSNPSAVNPDSELNKWFQEFVAGGGVDGTDDRLGFTQKNEKKKKQRPLAPIPVSRHALRPDQAAVYIGASPFFVEELIRNGEIPFRDFAQGRVVDADDLDVWLSKQPKYVIRNKVQTAA